MSPVVRIRRNGIPGLPWEARCITRHGYIGVCLGWYCVAPTQSQALEQVGRHLRSFGGPS